MRSQKQPHSLNSRYNNFGQFVPVNIAGTKFGKLLTINIVANSKFKVKGKGAVWKCMCDCGNYIEVPSHYLNAERVKECVKCKEESKEKTTEKTFVSRFKVNKETGCWEWFGCLNKSGYGKFCYKGKHILAHRYSWIKHKGDIGKLFVCHHCDNPPCVNPNHLFLGTAKDNTQDCIKKGRFALKPGVAYRDILTDPSKEGAQATLSP